MRYPTLRELPPPPPDKTGWPWTEESPPLPETMSDGSPWPRVSIVTPSYNQGQFIEETIRSVLLQGYPNLEYLVMDGGSSDGSVEILQKYAPWLVGWLSEKDKGQADAINKGWQRATGQIIAYLNSDDVYESGAVSRVVRFFSEHPTIGVVYANYRLIDAQGTIRYTNETPDFDLAQFLLGNYICQPTVFLRASVRRQVGELDATLRYVMDYEFLLRSALEGIQFAKIPGAPLARFRTWSGSKTAVKSEVDLREEQAMLQRCFDHPKMPPHLRVLRSEALARATIYVAYGYYWAADMKQARRIMRQAVAIHQPIVFKTVFWSVYLRTWLGARLNKWAREIRRVVLQRRARVNSSRSNAAK